MTSYNGKGDCKQPCPSSVFNSKLSKLSCMSGSTSHIIIGALDYGDELFWYTIVFHQFP